MALTNDTSMVDNDVNAIFIFEELISKYIWTSSEQRAHEKETVRTTINSISSAINTSFDFLGYLHELYLLANVTLIETDIVTVSELEYLRNVSLILNQQSSRTLQNYMV
ncbi:unnamed protein product [Rotaria sp. Silwood2]|nr:unnamed protein product [Rotaria sp. Silwood2]CAF3971600.1 unnamed protein product [Rotaria sp. Silwood2]CAF4069400.1 unnamed protein product [Rotaria sp. Silwood2]CAF4222624.1 unnamed protein product [Rotaria sp. Silwood2]